MLRQHGFTYVGMVILVTVLGLVGAATLKVDALLRRAAAEEELLVVGTAFADALTSYAAATPQGQPTQPPSLQELLRDSRSPAVRRHLRKIYIDPITHSTDWGIVWLADGKGVLAVYSKSDAQPLKIGNFDPKLTGFEDRKHIHEWRFRAAGVAPSVPAAGAAGAAGAAALPSLFAPAAPPPPPVQAQASGQAPGQASPVEPPRTEPASEAPAEEAAPAEGLPPAPPPGPQRRL